MLRNRPLFIAIVALLMSLFGSGAALAQDGDTSYLRFVHVIPGVGPIDVYINDNLSVSGLAYTEATNYIAVSGTTANLRVTRADSTATLWEQSVDTPDGEYQTLIASTIAPLAFDVYRDDLSPLAVGMTRFMVVHAVDAGPPVDFFAAGDAILTGLEYKGVINTIDAPANTYTMSALTSDGGEPVLPETEVGLTTRTSNVLVLYGPATGPDYLLLTAPTSVEGEAGFVRIAHGIAEAPAVNVTINGALAIPQLAYAEATEHLALEPGDYTVAVETLDGTELLSGDITVEAGTASTAAALGTADAPTLGLFSDAIAGVDARTAVVNVISTLAEGTTATLALNDGTILAFELGAGEESGATSLVPISDPLTLALTTGSDTETVELEPQTFYGGVYYNVFIVETDGSAGLVVAPTALAQTVNSAPGAAEAIVADVPTETPTLPPTVEPTVAPTVEAPAVEAPPAATTAPETAPPTATPPPPPTPEATGPTGRVLIDPGAGLNLRLFPSTLAAIQGQLGANTIVDILGRGSIVEITDIGRPETFLNFEEEFDPETLEDPVLELAEGEDLAPDETWLYIRYESQDGSEVRSWLRADFLDVRDDRGNLQRLADLPLIPGNTIGFGELSSIPEPQGVVANAVVFNLAPDVALLIRQRPAVGENQLERVFTGTVLDLLALGESGEWAFVRYNPPGGGTVTGWASTEYLQFQFNGRSIDLAELEQRGLLDADVSETTTEGGRTSDAPPVSMPTANPFRNVVVATVNVADDTPLNFRPGPDTVFAPTAELPNGTQLVVTGRTEDGEWLQAEFEGDTGWISSRFVTLTFNDRPYNQADLPVVATPEPGTTETEGEATAEPTATPSS